MKKFLIALLVSITIANSYAQDKSWLKQNNSLFVNHSSKHITIYYYDGSLSQSETEQILNIRELAYHLIANYFKIEEKIQVNIYLFPDEKTKLKVTGHKGYGWAFENNIVEVYNDEIRVDPYHELVHIIGNKIAKPDALIDEGIAVHLSQKYGQNPFSKILGYPDKSINQILKILLKNNSRIPLKKLFGYKNIGEAKNGKLAYCQSGSFVNFLIGKYGKKKFLELYASYGNNDELSAAEKFESIYGFSLEAAENRWIEFIPLT